MCTFQKDSTLRIAFTTVEGNRAADGSGGTNLQSDEAISYVC